MTLIYRGKEKATPTFFSSCKSQCSRTLPLMLFSLITLLYWGAWLAFRLSILSTRSQTPFTVRDESLISRISDWKEGRKKRNEGTVSVECLMRNSARCVYRQSCSRGKWFSWGPHGRHLCPRCTLPVVRRLHAPRLRDRWDWRLHLQARHSGEFHGSIG